MVITCINFIPLIQPSSVIAPNLVYDIRTSVRTVVANNTVMIMYFKNEVGDLSNKILEQDIIYSIALWQNPYAGML